MEPDAILPTGAFHPVEPLDPPADLKSFASNHSHKSPPVQSVAAILAAGEDSDPDAVVVPRPAPRPRRGYAETSEDDIDGVLFNACGMPVNYLFTLAVFTPLYLLCAAGPFLHLIYHHA